MSHCGTVEGCSKSFSSRERGATVTDEERDQSLAKIDVFKKWVDREIWQRHNKSDVSIMIVPQGRPGANYRDIVGTPAYVKRPFVLISLTDL